MCIVPWSLHCSTIILLTLSRQLKTLVVMAETVTCSITDSIELLVTDLLIALQVCCMKQWTVWQHLRQFTWQVQRLTWLCCRSVVWSSELCDNIRGNSHDKFSDWLDCVAGLLYEAVNCVTTSEAIHMTSSATDLMIVLQVCCMKQWTVWQHQKQFTWLV